MTNNEQAATSGFKDRKAGLIVFGIIQIIFGALSALMVPLLLLSVLAVSAYEQNGNTVPLNINMMIPGVLTYALAAAWFITMGIASIKAKRWARALVLISSWLWLISGAVGLIFMLFFMPEVYGRIGPGDQMPPAANIIMKYTILFFMSIFYVVIPGAFVCFYKSGNVKATCEARNPKACWTDRCPLPVLALSFIFAVWAFSMLFMGFYGWAVPFFGTILDGMRGAVVAIIAMLLFGYIAWGLYKLDIKAWCGSVLLTVAWFVSTGVTFSRVDMMDYYRKMNFPEEQIEFMKQYSMPQLSSMTWFFILWFIGFAGYLIYIRKYFKKSS